MTADLQGVFDFVLELDKLKSVLRKTKPLGGDRYESSAEHSWQVCLLAVFLAKESPKPINVRSLIEEFADTTPLPFALAHAQNVDPDDALR